MVAFLYVNCQQVESSKAGSLHLKSYQCKDAFQKELLPHRNYNREIVAPSSTN